MLLHAVGSLRQRKSKSELKIGFCNPMGTGRTEASTTKADYSGAYEFLGVFSVILIYYTCSTDCIVMCSKCRTISSGGIYNFM